MVIVTIGRVKDMYKGKIEAGYNNVIVSDRAKTSFRGVNDKNRAKGERTEVRYNSNKVFACTSLVCVENFVVFC